MSFPWDKAKQPSQGGVAQCHHNRTMGEGEKAKVMQQHERLRTEDGSCNLDDWKTEDILHH